MTAEEYYQEGNAWRKQGDFKRALDCYMEAIALDPESPAVTAKEMLDNIMGFYCKDYYNPSGSGSQIEKKKGRNRI